MLVQPFLAFFGKLHNLVLNWDHHQISMANIISTIPIYYNCSTEINVLALLNYLNIELTSTTPQLYFISLYRLNNHYVQETFTCKINSKYFPTSRYSFRIFSLVCKFTICFNECSITNAISDILQNPFAGSLTDPKMLGYL